MAGDPSLPALAQGYRLTGTLPPRPGGKAGSKKDWPQHLVLEAPFSPAAPYQSLYVGARDRSLLVSVDTLLGRRHGLHLRHLQRSGQGLPDHALLDLLRHLGAVEAYQHRPGCPAA